MELVENSMLGQLLEPGAEVSALARSLSNPLGTGREALVSETGPCVTALLLTETIAGVFYYLTPAIVTVCQCRKCT